MTAYLRRIRGLTGGEPSLRVRPRSRFEPRQGPSRPGRGRCPAGGRSMPRPATRILRCPGPRPSGQRPTTRREQPVPGPARRPGGHPPGPALARLRTALGHLRRQPVPAAFRRSCAPARRRGRPGGPAPPGPPLRTGPGPARRTPAPAAPHPMATWPITMTAAGRPAGPARACRTRHLIRRNRSRHPCAPAAAGWARRPEIDPDPPARPPRPAARIPPRPPGPSSQR